MSRLRLARAVAAALLLFTACHDAPPPRVFVTDAGTDASADPGDAGLADAQSATDADADAEAGWDGALPPLTCGDLEPCDYLQIAAYGRRTCALREDHSLWCWGAGMAPTRVELRANRVAQLSGPCLTTRDGTLFCLDDTRYVPVGGVREFEQVSWASTRGCAVLSGGRVSCWTNEAGSFPSSTPGVMLEQAAEQLVATQVSTSDQHVCIVDEAGALWCWGTELGGALGSLGDQREPLQLDPENTYRQVAAALQQTCGIRTDGTSVCWGQAYNNGPNPVLGKPRVPTVLAPDVRFAQLALGNGHGCAVAEDGTLWCWGTGEDGQLGAGDAIRRSQTPVRVGDADNWRAVTVALAHSCALNAAREVWCWGHNYNATLGSRTYGVTLTPTALAPEQTFVDLSMYSEGGCAVTQAGELWCWGRSGNSLPAGTEVRPSRIGVHSDWTRVRLGPAAGCGLRGDGALWCWGNNYDERLGPSNLSNSQREPFAVHPQLRFKSVSFGLYASCGIDVSGGLHCWGSNDYGAFARTDITSSAQPVAVEPARKFQSVSVTGARVFAVDAQGTLLHWGVGLPGPEIVQVLGSGYREVEADVHQCAIETSGTLRCWGSSNSYGQLGIGGVGATAVPTRVGDGYAQVALSSTSTCGIDQEGRLACWGELRGLASESSFHAVSPQPVQPQLRWQRVAMTNTSVCALSQEGSLLCWGDTESETFGPSGRQVYEPIRVPLEAD